MHQTSPIAEQREAEREAAQSLVGSTLDERYRLEDVVGQGGFAVVFRAADLRMNTEVAVKVAKPGSFDVAARFENEVSLSARLSADRSIARATDRGTLATAGSFDGCPYLVTSFVRGQDLESRLSYHHGTFPFDGAVRIARDLLRALEHLHERGIVHRDVKPSNVMVRDNGSAVLIDLGVAFATGEGEEHRSPDLTEVRKIVGTKLYMSPEQGLGHRPACSFDIYALGVTLYQVVTGSPPLRAIPDRLILKHKLNDKIPPVSRFRHDTPAELADVIDSMLAKSPEERPSATDALRRLQGLHSGPVPAFPKMLGAAPSSTSAKFDADADGPPPERHADILPLDPVSAPRRRGESPPETNDTEAPALWSPSKTRHRLLLAVTTVALLLAATTAWAIRSVEPSPPLRRLNLGALPNLPHATPPPNPSETRAPPDDPTPKRDSDVALEIPPAKDSPSEAKSPPVVRRKPDRRRKPPDEAIKPSRPSADDTDAADSERCAANRTAATQKLGMNKMKDVLAATADASCWKSNLSQRTYLRVTAHHSLGDYQACIREASKSKDARVLAFSRKCKQETEQR